MIGSSYISMSANDAAYTGKKVEYVNNTAHSF